MRGNSRILELLHLALTSRSYGARVVRTAVTMVAHNSPHPSLVPALTGLVFNSTCRRAGRNSYGVRSLGGPRGQPDGEGDDDAQAGDPDKQAFGDRAEGAEVVAARGAVGFDLLEEGDDVALALRGDVGVGEDRHVLRAGEHGLVDVLAGNVGQRRSELAPGQRAAGSSSVVAHGAVGAEQLAA